MQTQGIWPLTLIATIKNPYTTTVDDTGVKGSGKISFITVLQWQLYILPFLRIIQFSLLAILRILAFDP